MRGAIVVCLIACIHVLSPAAPVYACTSSHYPGNYADEISFTSGGGFLNSTPITSAISMWSSTCSEAGSAFPTLSYNGSGSINIFVELKSGRNPNPIGRCGFFDHDLGPSNEVIGGTIVVYEQASDGASCASTLVETIAHEIGHVLGLGDSGCSGHIMSSNPGYPSRSVQAAECDRAATQWTTSYEVGGGGGGGGTDQPGTNCPLLLDLDGGGVRTTSLLEPASFFDPDGDGIPNPGGWTDPTSEEAFVWIDVDGDDFVDRGELLGTGMELPGGALARNGFQVLQAYDMPASGGNGDGTISRADDIFHKLRLWVDRNHDGVSQPAELSAATSRVEAITVAFSHVHAPDGNGNVVMLTGTYVYRHGSQREVRSAVDIGFRVRSLSVP